jgi:hypothetical protein
MSFWRGVSLLFLTFSLTACMNQVGGAGSGNVSIVGDGDDELSASALAFKNHLQPLLAENCSNCHGAFQAPFIAYTDDVELNHDNVLAGSLADFNNVESSKLVSQLRLGHNCWTTSCNSDADEIAEAIVQWAIARGVEPEPEGLLTEAQEVPEAADVGLTTISFDLTEANPDLPVGSTLTLQIRRFDSFSYQIRNPRVIAPIALRLTNMNILINGISAHNGGTYTLLDVLVPITASPGLQLSASAILVSIGLGNALNPDNTPTGGPGEDEIQVQFDVLQAE